MKKPAVKTFYMRQAALLLSFAVVALLAGVR